MSKKSPVILWFRQDLRVADNPAMRAAAKTGRPVLPIYILDDDNAGDWMMGGASRWWLDRSLRSLNESLDGALQCRHGAADEILPELVREFETPAVFCNRCYEPWRADRDRAMESSLSGLDCAIERSNGTLLFEPQSITNKSGDPYRVFTPFWNNGCLDDGPAPRALIKNKLPDAWFRPKKTDGIDELELMPARDWYQSIAECWEPGEAGAKKKLRRFIGAAIGDYEHGRDFPADDGTSRLSPHLHFGEISPHQVWHAIRKSDANLKSKSVERFLSEIGWREFSYYLLFHQPEMPRKNLRRKFDKFKWRRDKKSLNAWQRGETGVPFVDAGMRELWQTGYMHNRVRMVTASFLVKNLLLHWHHGADWFWDTLVDADLANNSAGWQWVAGSGADAAPFFRIFNPVTQGRKFDPDGQYIRRYVPELAELTNAHIHEPWEAPDNVLAEAGVKIGRDYPAPIVDLKASRERALAAFKAL